MLSFVALTPKLGKTPDLVKLCNTRVRMPTESDLALARRALRAIAAGGLPTKEDALALRLWAIPSRRLMPLQDIAQEILMAAGESPEFGTSK